jgi:hypothetical protein
VIPAEDWAESDVRRGASNRPDRPTVQKHQPAAARQRAISAAEDLLRTALLASFAVDLQDPVLARRAAREALSSARLLCGLDFLPGAATTAAPERLPSRAEVQAL